MKLPFLYKNISSTPNYSSSCSSSSSSSSSSSWPWPSCHQNPKTLSFRNTATSKNPNLVNDETELAPATFSSSAAASEPPEEPESIENVIERLKSSKRLIFGRKGESNSILEEANRPRNGFMLLSLESNDPYADFKRSMEEMVETHKLHKDWKSLEKLLYWFLRVNAKSSHGYIFAAFVDLLVGLALKGQNDVVSSSTATDAVTVTVTETSSTSCSCSNDEGNPNHAGESPLSPLSFYTTSFSSDSDETSLSRPVPRVTDEISRVYCLSSLLEMEEKIKDIDVDDYVSC
ncbi:PREDICTED: transcription repressor OFP15-like [Tarenaya hassleriana]|uniref:transcription repressor OFP15-like n=1 Tax=Tarenaya hassleriana TaxID=28532 RepID=UPI00053C16AD|nr:PREDICTED: transcription repressor OFP15-like [Tarenaya hassleriana]